MKTNEEWINHISTNVSIDGKTGCWNWKKAVRKDGYGITWYNGTTDYIHRVSYKIFKGNFDPNYVVRHTCDNPSCCNPDHLLLGSDKDNSLDTVNRNRQSKGRHRYNAKLTADMIQPIRDSGLSSRVLGKLLGISKTVVLSIKRNNMWKHV